jgi:hypothetical protein
MGLSWAQHGMCELTWQGMAEERQRRGMGAAWHGRGTAGAWHGRGIGCVNKREKAWQRNSRGVAWHV